MLLVIHTSSHQSVTDDFPITAQHWVFFIPDRVTVHKTHWSFFSKICARLLSHGLIPFLLNQMKTKWKELSDKPTPPPWVRLLRIRWHKVTELQCRKCVPTHTPFLSHNIPLVELSRGSLWFSLSMSVWNKPWWVFFCFFWAGWWWNNDTNRIYIQWKPDKGLVQGFDTGSGRKTLWLWSTIVRLVSRRFTIFLRAERITGGQMWPTGTFFPLFFFSPPPFCVNPHSHILI